MPESDCLATHPGCPRCTYDRGLAVLERLPAHFTPEELHDLGFVIGFLIGQSEAD